MSPQYSNEDYVLALKVKFIPPFLIKKNQDFIIHHSDYGDMLKRLILKKGSSDEYIFAGLNEKSISSEEIGSLKKESLKGLVLWKIRKPSTHKAR
jgi:hypothetical protein